MANEGSQTDIYEAVINDLEAKIASLQMTVDNLKNVRGMTSALTATSSIQVNSPRQSNTDVFANDAFFGMSISEGAKKYLSSVKKTATVAVITEALLKGGLKSAATNMKENVRAILGRHPDFVRINGEFGLADWYPGRKPLKKVSLNPKTFSQDETEDHDDVIVSPSPAETTLETMYPRS